MPLSGATKFVGREKELQQLHQLLQKSDRVAIAAIAGMGGVGKTELALQYANTHRETYQGGICWLLPKAADVGLQLVQFARTHLNLNPPEISPDFDLHAQLAYCWRHWREGEVLLILDDVAKYKEVKPYLPPSSSRFKVLMTTRGHFGQIPKLSLGVLQPDAALELLRTLIGAERVNVETLHATSLCEWLGYLPLGLELVGRYLARKEDLSLKEMLQRLEKKRLEQPALVNSEDDMTAQLGVQAAFELSWQELNNTDKQLACLLSLFAPAPIPWELVEFCLPDVDAEELEESRDDKLLNLHLLQRKEKGIYQLHPLLREFFQANLETPAILATWGNLKYAFAKAMIEEVAKKIPQDATREQITAISPAIPHLAEVANNLIEYVSDEDLPWAFVGNARFYESQGLYDQAEPWYKLCLEVTKKRLRDEHPLVATSLNNLAQLYFSQGRYPEAEPLHQQALELTRRVLGDEHPDIAQSLNNLAGLYYSQGRYAEAEPLYQQALELTRRLLGEEHPSVATSLNNLALLYSSQGRYTEAEPLLQQALELTRRLLGDEHPSVATSLNNLALLYYSQGRYAEAEPLYQQALELTRRLLGEEHPNVATSLNSLALLYKSQGRYAEAEPLLQQALELTRRLLGDEHPSVAASLNNLAYLYKSQGRYADAEPLYKQALELTRRLLGEEHPHVAASLNNLANLYESQGRYAEAEPLLQQALELTRRLLGDEHPSVATSLNNLALLYDSQGRYTEAEPLYKQALELRRRLLGDEHPDVATSLNNL
uniref:tetratricopeptide repeat protein n=1 Tax=Brasilonema sp. UFV-L1 TaxID=2234130 RepID=UPI00145F4192